MKHFEAAAQPAVAADRFAREISAILTVCVMRSRQLNGNPLARYLSMPLCPLVFMC